VARLVDRLSGRLGRENVLRPRLEPDAQPEFAYSYIALGGRVESQRREEGQAGKPDLHRPLWLESPPVAVQVVCLAPDGPLAHFFYRGRLRKAARCWGPERIETGWWRGRSVRRDYYRVETESGHWFWLFRDLQNEGWYLHGVFE
jgi:protein ImuB